MKQHTLGKIKNQQHYQNERKKIDFVIINKKFLCQLFILNNYNYLIIDLQFLKSIAISMEKINNPQFLSKLDYAGQLPSILHTLIDKSIEGDGNHKRKINQKPQKSFYISSRNGMLAVIDEKQHLWIIGNKFTSPIDLSQILKMKALQVYLGQQQLIIQNKKHLWILIVWNSKFDFQEAKLTKMYISHPIFNYYNIESYFIDQNWNKGSFWYYSSIKKLDNIVKLYHIDSKNCVITGYPIVKKIQLPESISGMSLGKYHGLVWTESGKLFSWGCKNLALGLKNYNKSYYDIPQQIIMQQKILMAHAGVNYSIALGCSGNLYQWGIKNSSQPILSPRKIIIPRLKFLSIKGCNNMIAGLTSTNDLYIWGKGSEQICTNLSHVSCDNGKMYLMIKRKHMKINSYAIQQNYVITVSKPDNGGLNPDQNKYFQQVLRKTTKKWFPHKLHKQKQSQMIQMQNNMSQNQRKMNKSVDLLRKNQDYIDRLICHKTSKQNYFKSLKNQQSIFKEIMKDNQPIYNHVYQSEQLENKFNFSKNSAFGSCDQFNRHGSANSIIQSSKQTPHILMSIQASHQLINQMQAYRILERKSSNRRIKTSNIKRSNLNYQLRLKNVLQKKNQIQQDKREQRIKTIQKKALVLQRQKRNQQEQQFFAGKKQLSCLQAFFIKNFICQMLNNPLQLGRQLKIKTFMTNLSFNRISNKMKNILYKRRAINLLKNLKEKQSQKFQMLKRLFLKAFQRRRLKIIRNCRQLIIKEIIKRCNLKKLNQKMCKLWIYTRKLQKVAKWIFLQEKQHMNQLRFIWKKSILLYLKPTPSFQNKKNSVKQQCTMKHTLQKFKNEKLATYLKNSPLIKFLPNIKCTLRQLQDNFHNAKSYAASPEYTKFGGSLSMKRNISWKQTITKQKDAVMFDKSLGIQRKFISSNHSNYLDLLIYSQHHDYFYKPKNYQINIPDNMKTSQKWILQEKKILITLLKNMIQGFYKKYYRQILNYEYQLGQFIKENYELLTQYRWKFIIEYNSIKNQNIKKNSIDILKKTRDLKRILSLVNAEYLFINDVLPEKYMILDYAKKNSNAPTPPSLQIKLNQEEFKKQFKNYCENVSLKVKQVKKAKTLTYNN